MADFLFPHTSCTKKASVNHFLCDALRSAKHDLGNQVQSNWMSSNQPSKVAGRLDLIVGIALSSLGFLSGSINLLLALVTASETHYHPFVDALNLFAYAAPSFLLATAGYLIALGYRAGFALALVGGVWLLGVAVRSPSCCLLLGPSGIGILVYTLARLLVFPGKTS